MIKLHKQIYIKYGNTQSNTTLCHRRSRHTSDGFQNIAESDSEVTCKICLKKMGLGVKV